ncbi:hypothetical protein AR457_20230 [Streptomyces agglomeratus]|uniref:Uncharacterized protein n=1 Tax=Streptomyces agglomeratus TaxID=285458 RepID=A0A1E5PA64_9ACTN|nr:hypothetical protein [Streptomyces agglomeratus]OEJ26430.1 hypothetical protein AS594_19990 [Streptomyces agglomeratus]OEJ39506.1 hypothetical protein BGK70_16420 [Streptomyces agglomeratus]OEJ46110.1 hypothetical protein AR457_20230 [Streptomyces agglomeratus]OEJ52073.1 hypothetical protein BGK72_16120 [Streptomyces agglomeratus]OEJ59428.1 hypothetical protein BGM19_16960 [Streptomyces agglomeratus]
MTDLTRRFWRSATGADGVSTVGYLRRQLVWLLALTVVGGAALFGAYDEVHSDSVAIRDRTAPAVVELAKAHTSLQQAHNTAVDHLYYRALHPEWPDILARGEEYRTQVAEAKSSLGRAAATGALNREDRQTLRIVSGLVDSYALRIDGAWTQSSRPELSSANLSYARRMMYVADSGILDRIAALQSRQNKALDHQEDWGAAPLLAWPVAVAACVLLGIRLVGTQVFLRRRFRMRLSIPLAAVTLLLAAVPVLAFGTWQAHASQTTVQHEAATLEPADPPTTQVTAIAAAESRMDRAVRQGNTATWARGTAFIPLAAVLMAGVILWTLQSHLLEYAVPRRRTGGNR